MDFNKPRVALYYDILPSTGFRNDGACLFLSYNFRKLLDGEDALTDNKVMSRNNGNFHHLQPNMPMAGLGTFDLNILVDYGEDGLGIPLNWEIPHPNAYWIADSHLGYDYRLQRAKQFDFVFASHIPSIEKMVRDGIDPLKIRYLPWAAEPACFKPYPIIEKWDWSFIGHLNNEFRIDLCDRFIKEFGLGDGKGYIGWRQQEWKGHNVLDDVAKKFSQSRIVINEAIQDDLNMRVFEALACKRLLLTEDIKAVRDHFEDGKHLVMFKTIEEAVEKAKYYLAHADERNAIAEAGYQEFLSKHTYMHRAKELLKVCIGYDAEEKTLARAL